MKGFIAIVCLAVMGVGVWLGAFADNYYTGKETFRTEQEYTLFKEAISSPEVHILSMQSLSSEPPIIVNFRITAPTNEAFPYGQKDEFKEPGGYGLCGLGFAGLCFLLRYKPKQAED